MAIHFQWAQAKSQVTLVKKLNTQKLKHYSLRKSIWTCLNSLPLENSNANSYLLWLNTEMLNYNIFVLFAFHLNP